MKKKTMIALIAVAILVCAGIGISFLDFSHEHAFGDWETLTGADCENAEIQVRRCECGEEETREGAPTTGHDFISISAESLLETPMATMVVTAGDLRVTGTCGCGADVVITEGIELEGAALGLGENTVTVKYGALSTTLTIQASPLDIALNGIVSDDTAVSSGGMDSEYASKKDLGTKSDMYRVYYRVNIRDILDSPLFEANRDNAKVQLILTVTGGSVTDETVFTLKAYDPALPETDVDFSQLTWNSVSNKEEAVGAYAALHWSSGTTILSGGAGHHVSTENGQIVITLDYSQIADFVDEGGNILFAFAANTDNLKVGALENKTETNKPRFQVVLNDDHFHVFDQENTAQQYLVSGSCTERAKYLKSCACGEPGTETFTYGEAPGHTYSSLIARKDNTCTTDGVKAHYRCTVCGKYFVEKNGEKVATSLKSLKISAGHDYKLIQAKAATCTQEGNQKYFKCADCGKYFDAQKKVTTKEAQKIPALGHTYSALIPEQASTCTAEGMKAHYRCTVCGKYFVEKNGQKVATSAESLKIAPDHTYKLIQAKAATCTKDGNYKYYKCADCGKYFDAQKKATTKEAQTIPALGHTYSDLIAQQDATCTEDGMRAHYRCTVCGKYFVEKDGKMVETTEAALKIAAGHTYKVIQAKAATCTKDGNYKYYKCDACGKYFDAQKNETTKEAQKIPALGHDMVMKWDDTHHWSECANGCGESTAHEAHSGGAATETEQAKCEVCGQPYGALKPTAAPETRLYK